MDLCVTNKSANEKINLPSGPCLTIASFSESRYPVEAGFISYLSPNEDYVAVTCSWQIGLKVNTIEPATISQKVASGEECFPLMEDRKNINIESGYSFYLVDTKVPIDLAVGLIGEYEFSRLHFDYCSTSEGVLYSAKSGEDTLCKGKIILAMIWKWRAKIN